MKNNFLVIGLLAVTVFAYTGCKGKGPVEVDQAKQVQTQQVETNTNAGGKKTQSGSELNGKNETDKNKTDSSYIFDDSDQKILKAQDVEMLDETLQRYARNEIYARHGYIFTDKELQSYFDKKTWYTRNPEFKGAPEELSYVEKSNVSLLKDFETGKIKTGVEKFIEGYFDDISKEGIYSFYLAGTFEAEKGVKNVRKTEKEIGKILIDLDGDGQKDKISVSGKYYLGTNSEYGSVASDIMISLFVNDQKLEWTPVSLTAISIVDIDMNDNQKELALYDDGPSNDPTTEYYILKNGKMEKMGEIPGYGKISGDGKISTFERTDFLTTHSRDAEYELVDSSRLKKNEIEYYAYSVETTANANLKLRKEAKSSAQFSIEIKKGEKVEFLKTNESWLQIQNSKGEKGWIEIKKRDRKDQDYSRPNSQYGIEGTELTISDVFPELDNMYAD